MKPRNIHDSIPLDLTSEFFEDIVRSPTVRIERIVSKGHTSPENGWYDQDEHEWVIVLKGKAVLELEDGSTCHLESGDYLNIRAHCRHKVFWTDPDQPTLWLAVFYK